MFGYRCNNCDEGIVKEWHIGELHTKIEGRPFIVNDAIVGVCDTCGMFYRLEAEVERWKQLFKEGIQENIDREELDANI